MLRAYSIRYRETDEAFEAKPTYRYDCFICGKAVRGWIEYPGGYRQKGHEVVNVLQNGQTVTVHTRCNRSRS